MVGSLPKPTAQGAMTRTVARPALPRLDKKLVTIRTLGSTLPGAHFRSRKRSCGSDRLSHRFEYHRRRRSVASHRKVRGKSNVDTWGLLCGTVGLTIRAAAWCPNDNPPPHPLPERRSRVITSATTGEYGNFLYKRFRRVFRTRSLRRSGEPGDARCRYRSPHRSRKLGLEVALRRTFSVAVRLTFRESNVRDGSRHAHDHGIYGPTWS